MSKKTLTQVWTAVHLFAVYVGINAILVLRRSPILLPMVVSLREGSHRGEVSTALFWFVLSSSGLLMSSILALIYVRGHSQSEPDAVRAPIMFSIELLQGTGLARAYQAFWVVIAMALAFAGVVLAGAKTLGSPVYECDAPATTVAKESSGAPPAPASKSESASTGAVPANARATAALRREGGIIDALYWHTGPGTARFDGCELEKGAPGSPTAADEGEHVGVEYIPFISDTVVGLLGLSALSTTVLFWWVSGRAASKRWHAEGKRRRRADLARSA